VAAIGVAQEFAPVFTGTERPVPNNISWFSFTKTDRRVTCYYFYLWDTDFGPYAERPVMPSVEVKVWACQLILK
jgi:hypothetical protein